MKCIDCSLLRSESETQYRVLESGEFSKGLIGENHFSVKFYVNFEVQSINIA